MGKEEKAPSGTTRKKGLKETEKKALYHASIRKKKNLIPRDKGGILISSFFGKPIRDEKTYKGSSSGCPRCKR